MRHAAHLNIICAPDELPRKRAALDTRLGEVGRDHIDTSVLVTVVVDETHDKAHAALRDSLRSRGFDLDTVPEETRNRALARFFVGGPDEVAEQIQTGVPDAGIDG